MTNIRAQNSTSQVGKAYSVKLVGFLTCHEHLLNFITETIDCLLILSVETLEHSSLYLSFFTGVWHSLDIEYMPTTVMRYGINQYLVIL